MHHYYSLHIYNLLQLSDLMPDVVIFDEVQEFFAEKWAPHVVGLHSCGGGILSTFFSGVCKALEGLQVYEVLDIIVLL